MHYHPSNRPILAPGWDEAALNALEYDSFGDAIRRLFPGFPLKVVDDTKLHEQADTAQMNLYQELVDEETTPILEHLVKQHGENKRNSLRPKAEGLAKDKNKAERSDELAERIGNLQVNVDPDGPMLAGSLAFWQENARDKTTLANLGGKHIARIIETLEPPIGHIAMNNKVESRSDAVADAPFPLPAHRTGRADFPHPALGQELTPSPTESLEVEHSSE